MTATWRTKDRRDRLLLALVAIAPLLPAFFVTRAFTGDAQAHWKWQYHFARQFWGGDLLPRWLTEHNEGFGSPAFFYYAPLTQWLTSLWAPLLPGPETIPARFVLTLMLFSIIGAFGARAWIALATGDRRAAMVGALLYTLLPYHAYVNVFQRGAFAELAAMAWLPWTFYGTVRAVREGRVSFTLIAALALLCISHAPSVLMIVPALAVVGLYEAAIARSARGLMACAASGIVALLLAAFYLLPAFMLTGALNNAALFGPYFAPTQWMMFGPSWPNPGTSLYTHALFLLYALAGVVAGLLLWIAPASAARATAAKVLAGFVAVMLLMTVVAAPFWEHVTLAAKIQFPWRLMTLATLLLALAGAVAVISLADRWRGRAYPAVVAILMAALLAVNGGFFAARLVKADREGRAPPGIAQTLADRRDQNEYRVGDLTVAGRLFGPARTLTSPPGPSVQVDSWTSRKIALATDFARPTTLLVHQFAYTGWTVAIDGGAPSPAMRAASGVVAAIIPAGRHRLILALPLSIWERWGWWLSAIGLGLVALILALRRRRDAR